MCFFFNLICKFGLRLNLNYIYDKYWLYWFFVFINKVKNNLKNWNVNLFEYGFVWNLLIILYEYDV